MQLNKIAQAVKTIRIEKARKDFGAFVRYVKPDFKESAFSDMMFQAINEFIDKLASIEITGNEEIDNKIEFPKTLIEGFPRSGKTLLVSHMLPAYCFGYFKGEGFKIIACSFGEELLATNARAVKRILSSAEYQEIFGNPFEAVDVSRIDTFQVFDGEYRAFTVNGGIIGAGANLLIVDDPIKNTEMGFSKTLKDKLEDWFNNDASTRLEGKHGTVLMHQRFAVDDLAGRIKEDKYKYTGWQVYTFRALDDNDESTMPNRIPTSYLLGLRKTNSNFEAMYQQNPVARGGNIIKTEAFKYFDLIPEGYSDSFIIGDTAVSGKQSNDFSVFGYYRVYDKKLYLVDLLRIRVDLTELIPNLRAFLKKWNESKLFIEVGTAGTPLMQLLRKEGIPTTSLSPESKDKYTRLQMVLPYIDNGLVYLPKNASWVSDFLRECGEFTANDSHPHDDQVDVLIYGLDRFKKYTLGYSMNIDDRLDLMEAFDNEF